MADYRTLQDLIRKDQLQELRTSLELRTGINKNFIRLELDQKEQIRLSFSADFSKTSPYRYGATITPDWTVLEPTDCARNLAECLRGFGERNSSELNEIESLLHQQTKQDLTEEYFPKYSYADLKTQFVHTLNCCAMSEESLSFTVPFHNHTIEISTNPEKHLIASVTLDGKEVYDIDKGAVGHDGIADLLSVALCEDLYKEGMYDYERTLQDFEDTYGISQLSEEGAFHQDISPDREVNWMNDILFDPLEQSGDWDR
ncbi:hypothetical protein [Clostridium porci]|uniref:Uncharacterized protein n=1 Tax=Clostridium porci TaxID=2605778 RepID=A0A7X2TE98_9CLOT|nr:hypothetical protein [Clostridium porci]MSS38018.1 hypothetical protein [Clostridium porci]